MDETRTTTWFEKAAMAASLAAIAVWAWLHRFLIDDAFISMRYAKMAAEGHGLVYNEGVWVEGYTNFLWTLMIVPSFWLGVDPKIWVLGMCATSFAFVFAVFTHFAKLQDTDPALLWPWWLALGSGSMTTFATTGMETMLQAGLIALLHAFALQRLRPEDPWHPKDLIIISALAALAMMTRLDSAILLVVPALVLIEAWGRYRGFGVRHATAFLVPVLALVGGWFAWKVATYGDILPNTFYAKTGDDRDLGRGLFYVGYFLGNTFWIAPLLMIMAAAVKSRAARDISLFLGSTVLWCAYVVWTGGDFMEFRFMVPMVPLVAMGALLALKRLELPVALGVVLAIIIALAGVVQSVTYGSTRQIMRLGGPFYDPPHRAIRDWSAIGTHLAETFVGVQDLHISTATAGAMPYHAGWRTLDMHGLTEPWVARNGVPYLPVPGHTKIAPLTYLLDQGVHLNVQFPVRRETKGRTERVICERALKDFHGFSEHPGAMEIVAVDIDPKRYYLVMVVTPHPEVDRILEGRGDVRLRVDPSVGCEVFGR